MPVYAIAQGHMVLQLSRKHDAVFASPGGPLFPPVEVRAGPRPDEEMRVQHGAMHGVGVDDNGNHSTAERRKRSRANHGKLR